MNKILLLIMLLAFTAMACQAPLRIAATSEPERIVISGEASAEVEQILATAVAELQQTGSVTLSLTEVHLTSYLAEKLAAQPDNPLQNPQIFLRNGVIELTGETSIGDLTANTSLILEPYADQGDFRVSIQEANFGSIPIPEGALNTLADTINQNLGALVTVNGQKFNLQSVVITDGVITLSGNLP